MAKLEFINQDATQKVVEVICDASSIADIMRWYGAYFAGDRYAVIADGVKLKKDQNGELIHD